MNTHNLPTYIARGVCLLVGAALAGVGMNASYEAAAKVGNEYLMIAAPLVALAAPSTAVFIEIACNARQYLKALALLLVFGLCSATVFFTAAERNHDGRAVGEAQRTAYRTAVDRAAAELTEAKTAASATTLAANKLRGGDGPKARSAKASEAAALDRVAKAEQAVRDAEAKKVTESDIKQADWLMPLAIDFASVVMLWAGFGLGRIEHKPTKVVTETVYVAEPVMIEVPAPVEAKELKKLNTRLKRQQTELTKLRTRDKARKNGPKLAVSRA